MLKTDIWEKIEIIGGREEHTVLYPNCNLKEEAGKYFVYVIWCDFYGEGIRYIGTTNNMKRRISQHLSDEKDCHNKHKKYWIKKIGKENIKFNIIYVFGKEEESLEKEKYAMEDLKTIGVKLLNTKEGGIAPPKIEWTAEKRKIMSDKLKEYNRLHPEAGRAHSERSKSFTFFNDENYKKKMSENKIKYYKNNLEARKIISVAVKNRWKKLKESPEELKIIIEKRNKTREINKNKKREKNKNV